jgi:hypothetical protein
VHWKSILCSTLVGHTDYHCGEGSSPIKVKRHGLNSVYGAAATMPLYSPERAGAGLRFEAVSLRCRPENKPQYPTKYWFDFCLRFNDFLCDILADIYWLSIEKYDENIRLQGVYMDAARTGDLYGLDPPDDDVRFIRSFKRRVCQDELYGHPPKGLFYEWNGSGADQYDIARSCQHAFCQKEGFTELVNVMFKFIENENDPNKLKSLIYRYDQIRSCLEAAHKKLSDTSYTVARRINLQP